MISRQWHRTPLFYFIIYYLRESISEHITYLSIVCEEALQPVTSDQSIRLKSVMTNQIECLKTWNFQFQNKFRSKNDIKITGLNCLHHEACQQEKQTLFFVIGEFCHIKIQSVLFYLYPTILGTILNWRPFKIVLMCLDLFWAGERWSVEVQLPEHQPSWNSQQSIMRSIRWIFRVYPCCNLMQLHSHSED